MTLFFEDLLRENAVLSLVVAGWTGRDAAAVRRHVEELRQLGVEPPRRTPCFYELGRGLLTTAPEVDVIGSRSSGEVEFVLVAVGGALFVGVGSDHTDRGVEAHDIATAKQMCPKPVAPVLWPLESIGHWDELVLRSYIYVDGRRVLYQQGCVAEIQRPADLIDRFTKGRRALLPDGTVMFCGTLPVIGESVPARQFGFELEDPVRDVRIAHSYRVRQLPPSGIG
ncbi:hypothetical protein ADK67_31160 [Saccharothrix sp. NRRL B-16348]|uniref:DUF2848 domain-containing protein n=1 Tax=Saccharothrix sp. NRRL B-16348 TaxID=1415542 RepID=UPI0006AE7F0A|nr:DUF2848 domain-containing protein [Saccharothrix sp. NRRL B-16348]KOX20030.1 hypothetical protein ADK67_31160 [Saccharothrix sp. NRRL B-16348]